MVPFSQLLAPIGLSAGLVFVASSLIHMVIRYHNADYRRLPDEDGVASALRRCAASPGQYMVPHCTDPKAMGTSEMQQKFAEGPIATIYLKANGPMQLGPFLARWFGYSLAISAICAYLAHAQLAAGAAGSAVFRLVGTTAWLAYAWQGPAESIWKGKPWAVTGKEMFDGLIYACLTGAAFAWLWPHAG